MGGAPRPEAVAAAAWWAGQLGVAEHNIGTRTCDERLASAAVIAVAELVGHQYSDAERERFAGALANQIEHHLETWERGIWAGAWRPDDPAWASALRVIGCGSGPDPVFCYAAADADVPFGRFDLPVHTTMWINPGQVSVAVGHGSAGVTIWPRLPNRYRAASPDNVGVGDGGPVGYLERRRAPGVVFAVAVHVAVFQEQADRLVRQFERRERPHGGRWHGLSRFGGHSHRLPASMPSATSRSMTEHAHGRAAVTLASRAPGIAAISLTIFATRSASHRATV